MKKNLIKSVFYCSVLKNTFGFGGLFVIAVILFSFCNEGSQTSKATTNDTEIRKVIVLDTSLDKYCGCYKFLNKIITIGKFPPSSKVPTKGSGYIPLNKEMIGKYFMIETYACVDTKKEASYAGGFIVPHNSGAGSVLLGVDSKGVLHLQNYTIGSTFALGGTDSESWGKLVVREDGKYNLTANGATYVFQ